MKLSLLVAFLIIASVASAQDHSWQSGSGDFSQADNWNPASVPGITDNCLFPNNGSYTLSFTRSETNQTAVFTADDGGDVAFDLNGRTWQLTNGLSYAASALNSRVTLDNGRLEALGNGIDLSCFGDALPSYLTLGADSASELSKLRLNNAHLTVKGGTHVVNGEIWMPSAGSDNSKISSLTVSNATLISKNSLWCGGGNTSTGIVNILSGGSMTVSNNFSIGDQRSTAVGMVNITGGDLYTYGANWLGNASGATGIMNLSGGSFTCKNRFEVGHRLRAIGILNISGGQFTANSDMIVANFENTGNSTTGTVTVTGGAFEVKSSLNIGANTNCMGKVLISGVSTSTLERVRVGYGPGGYGEFHLTNALVTLSSDLEIGSLAGSSGLVTIDGGVYSNKNTAIQAGLYGAGQMVVNGGELYVSGPLQVGRYAGGSGAFEMNGGALSCNNLVFGDLNGGLGTGTLNGGVLETRGGTTLIGSNAGASGTFAVTGGRLTAGAGGFISGNSGTGALNLSGGCVTFSSGLTSGNNSGSTGAVSITGGSVTNSAYTFVGNNAGSSGTLAVDGGTLYCSAKVHVGNYGTGTLTLSDGNLAFMDGLAIGNYASGTGFVTIAGGTLTNRADAFVGESGVGHLTISGGTNYFTSKLTVGNNRAGYLNITGGETYNTGERINTSPGYGSTSRIDMSGGHLTVTGYLDIGGAGMGVLAMTGGQIDTKILRIATGNGPIPVVSKIIMNGGRLNVLDVSYLVDRAVMTGEVHLVNGVLSVKQLRGWWGQLEVFFDGGTLEARQNNSNFIYHNNIYPNPGGTERPLYHILTARGLVVDSNGYNVGTPLSLPDAPGEQGRLTKKGAGIFTISGTTSFTGPIVIERGEVELSGSGMVTLAGGVQIDGAGLLDLHLRNQDFTMGAGSLSRIDGTVDLADGRSLIFPATATLSGTGTVVRVTLQSGSTLVKNSATGAANLRIAALTLAPGANVELTGYTDAEFRSGITFVNGASLTLPGAAQLNFTLNGVAYASVAVNTSANAAGGYDLTAHYFDPGTVIIVR